MRIAPSVSSAKRESSFALGGTKDQVLIAFADSPNDETICRPKKSARAPSSLAMISAQTVNYIRSSLSSQSYQVLLLR